MIRDRTPRSGHARRSGLPESPTPWCTKPRAVADFLCLDVHLSYYATSALWAIALVVVFVVWHRTEGALSIHSIITTRREIFYWLTVFATPALGTALYGVLVLLRHDPPPRRLDRRLAGQAAQRHRHRRRQRAATLAFFTLGVVVLVVYLTIRRPDIEDEPELV